MASLGFKGRGSSTVPQLRPSQTLRPDQSSSASARGITRSLSRFIAAPHRFFNSSDSDSGADNVGRRLWGVVRSVVLADNNCEDVRLAFEQVHAQTGRRPSTVQDPRKYLFAWRQARLLFIRARLRGEWFPEAFVEAKPPRCAPRAATAVAPCLAAPAATAAVCRR